MNQGIAVVWLLPTSEELAHAAGTNADLPPSPSISPWLNECRPPVLENAPTHVVPSCVTSGPTPLVRAVVILLNASPHWTRVPWTWMFGWTASNACASELKYPVGSPPLGMYQTWMVTFGWFLS